MPMEPTYHPTFFFPMGFIVFGLMVWSLYWVYHDARDRGKNPWLICLLVVFFYWPFSLLLWYVFRPETVEQTTETDPELRDYED